MTALAECPNAWCKSTDIADSHDGAEHKRYMRCNDCNLQGPYGTKETIGKLWNEMANDHVSKKALREWCEAYLESTKRSTALHEICSGNFVRGLLEKFCGEE